MTELEKDTSASNASSKTLSESERTRCEVWSRVMGYHRPISGWNIGKKQEFADRKVFKEPKEAVNGSVN
jgi:anaerobic ribonucleoside-triphosphate reductase